MPLCLAREARLVLPWPKSLRLKEREFSWLGAPSRIWNVLLHKIAESGGTAQIHVVDTLDDRAVNEYIEGVVTQSYTFPQFGKLETPAVCADLACL